MKIIVKTDVMQKKRAELGYSVRGLAKKAGLSSGYCSQLELHKRFPSPAAAKKLCKALQIQFDDLFIIETDKTRR